LKEILPQVPVLYVDETSLPIQPTKHWLHVICTPLLTSFSIQLLRDREAIGINPPIHRQERVFHAGGLEGGVLTERQVFSNAVIETNPNFGDGNDHVRNPGEATLARF
jgi:hypothetical protein